ncbi:MAG: hypothetical protein KAT65_00365, partial [Methanophagales archaeon]|nr:hypothetical protein [Methanophagales archaeon]
CTEQGFLELSKISGGTVSKILSKSDIKPHKIAGCLERRDSKFKKMTRSFLRGLRVHQKKNSKNVFSNTSMC